MAENQYDSIQFETWPASMIDSLLQKFYSALQTKDGKDYSKPSLVGLRAGINRHLTGAPHCRTINIMKDREFMTSNQVLNGLVKKLKREGKDFSVNKEPVSSANMQKIYDAGLFALDRPNTLQNKVLFDIIRHFGRRGREGLASLRKNSFVKAKDSEGYLYFKMSYNEADKTHHGLDSREKQKEPRMYEQQGHDNCPVKSFEKYLSKLNPSCDILFQRPLLKVRENDQIWFAKVNVGLNTLYNFMSRISDEAKLSRRYTNHCLRAEVASTLYSAGVSSKGIMAVTGHRNVQSLASYVKPTDSEKRKISTILSNNNEVSSNECSSETKKRPAHLLLPHQLPEMQQPN